MKNITYKILVILLSAFIFAACDDDNDSAGSYQPANNEANFPKASSNYVFGGEDPAQFTVTVRRSNPNGAVSIPLAVTDASGLFTVSQTVDFADTSYETIVTITFDRNSLVTGKEYLVEIALPKHTIKEKITTHKVTIIKDYIWAPFATGTVDSYFGIFTGRVLYKATDADRYKLDSFIANGYGLTFDVDSNGKITPVGLSLTSNGYSFSTGFQDSTYGPVSAYLDNDPTYTYFDSTTKTLVLSLYYYVSAGNFGWKDDTFTWQ